MNIADRAASMPQTGASFTTIAVVLAVILAAGLIGGWAAYLAGIGPGTAAVDRPVDRRTPLRFLVMGCVASACVPLFLSLVQSNLITTIFGSGSAPPFEQYLVLAGLCLIAAFSARAFLESVSRRVLRDLEDVKEKQHDIQQQVAQTAEIVDEQSATPVSSDTTRRAALFEPRSVPGMDDLEVKALQALTKMTFRTASGVASDIGISRNRVGELLDSLSAKGLATITTSPTTKGVRWRITEDGIGSLNPAEIKQAD
jgi:hypothetical protein